MTDDNLLLIVLVFFIGFLLQGMMNKRSGGHPPGGIVDPDICVPAQDLPKPIEY